MWIISKTTVNGADPRGAWSLALVGIVAAAAAMVGCDRSDRTGPTPSISAFVAAGMTDAFTEIARRYERQHGGKVHLNFAASSTLAQQIAAGAPADVYVSANRKWMDFLTDRMLVESDSVTTIAGNRLVLIAAEGKDIKVRMERGFDLAGAFDGRLSVGDPEHVPAGMYAREALTHLGWWQDVRNRLAAAATVRAALRFVETGQADVGIVYETDAIASDEVDRVAAFPAGSHSPIEFLTAISSSPKPGAKAFLRFLSGPEAASVLCDYGFQPVRREEAGAVGAGLMARFGLDESGPLALSIRVACFSVAVAAIPGVACAWLLARRSFFGKSLLDGLVHAPLVMPPVTTGYIALILLGRNGPIGAWLYERFGVSLAFSWAAAVVMSAAMGFPLIVRSIRLSIESIDHRIEQAARTLGAGPLRVFCTITLPLAVPGIVAGLVLGFARSLGEFGATITFAGNIEGQTRTLPLAIFTLVQQPGGDAAAMHLIGISVALSLGALAISELLLKRVRRQQAGAWACSN